LRPRETRGKSENVFMELKKSVFVVMPFGDDVAGKAYEQIVQPVCRSQGFEVVRADEIHSTQVIYNDIVQGIRNATITIVDISGKNPNVMYELGVAHVLNQQATIMLTHDDVGESPFDIKHFRIIPYKDTIEGTKKLEDQLLKTIEMIKCNPRIFFRQEFEFLVSVLEAVDKRGDLITFLGLKNFSGEAHIMSMVGSKGKDRSKSEIGSHNASIGHALTPFLKMQFVEINNRIISTTEKGKAFGDMLEEIGYVCDEFAIGSTANSIFFGPNFQPPQP